MLTSELLEKFRRDFDDLEEPYLISDAEFYEFLDDAQREFARLTNYFQDSSTAAVCQLAVTASTPLVSIDSRILEVREARLASTDKKLEIKNLVEVDLDDATGTPSILVFDVETDKVRLYPEPTESDTINLKVTRYPLEEVDGYSELEVSDPRLQRKLLMWVVHMAYSKEDSEVYNPDAASKFERRFIGFCEQFKNERMRLRRRPGAVKYGGL